MGSQRQLVLFVLPGHSRVYVYPIRKACEEAVAKGQFTWSDIARACGYYQNTWYKKPDTGRLKRALGLRARQRRVAYPSMQMKTALTIISALNLDPVDFDL